VKISFVIHGEPASKANSRDIVTRRKRDETGTLKSRPMSIKSDKARDYERNALKQIPPRARVQLAGPVRVTLRIYYASERPDLDESVVLDVMQNRYVSVKRRGVKARELVQRGVYLNDRQVREKHIYHGIDRKNPRVEVEIEPLQAQQSALALDHSTAFELA